MLQFTLKYLIFAPTCFGPSGPSSGSFGEPGQSYTFVGIISNAVLWQQVF